MSLFSQSGSLLRVGLALAGDSKCCCNKTPCGCTPDLYNTSYAIDLYENGYFVTCVDCILRDGGEADPNWDGVFIQLVGTCTWFDIAPGFEKINGKTLAVASIELITTDDPNCFWRLTIRCLTIDSTSLIWQGEQNGPTPAGTYGRTDGCDPRLFVVVV